MIPAVSPSLGKTRAGPTTRTLPPFSQTRSHSSRSVVQLKQFYVGSTDFQATSEAHTRPVRVDLGVFVLVEAFENKQEDRGPQSCEVVRLQGRRKKTIT